MLTAGAATVITLMSFTLRRPRARCARLDMILAAVDCRALKMGHGAYYYGRVYFHYVTIRMLAAQHKIMIARRYYLTEPYDMPPLSSAVPLEYMPRTATQHFRAYRHATPA